MPKKSKTLTNLRAREETEFKPLSKKQKLRYFETKERSKVGVEQKERLKSTSRVLHTKSNLKDHFPDRIWNNASEKRKGPKV
ncbi:MAG: hypothetical protein V1646_04100 [bacterium]